MKRFVIEVLTVQQDYLWFLASLGLLVAGMLALRPAAGGRSYPWAAWVMGGYLAMAMAELVRIAQIVRPPEMGPPNLELDLLHGMILGVQVWAIGKPEGRRGFWLLLLAAVVVLAGLRLYYPWSITVGMVVAATVGLGWRARQETDETGRRLAWSLIPGFWLSPTCMTR